jgi:hypothetical protein
MTRRTMPAVFTLQRDKEVGGWRVYHDERGYIGRLKRKSVSGAVRLLHESRKARSSSGPT